MSLNHKGYDTSVAAASFSALAQAKWVNPGSLDFSNSWQIQRAAVAYSPKNRRTGFLRKIGGDGWRF